jgi:hypothetical protein
MMPFLYVTATWRAAAAASSCVAVTNLLEIRHRI